MKFRHRLLQLFVALALCAQVFAGNGMHPAHAPKAMVATLQPDASEAGAADLRSALIRAKHAVVCAQNPAKACSCGGLRMAEQLINAALSAPAGASLLARQEALERDLANARRFLLQLADDEERHVGPSGVVTIRPRIWDHACGQCIPGGDLVKPGFVCAVHAARSAPA